MIRRQLLLGVKKDDSRRSSAVCERKGIDEAIQSGGVVCPHCRSGVHTYGVAPLLEVLEEGLAHARSGPLEFGHCRTGTRKRSAIQREQVGENPVRRRSQNRSGGKWSVVAVVVEELLELWWRRSVESSTRMSQEYKRPADAATVQQPAPGQAAAPCPHPGQSATPTPRLDPGFNPVSRITRNPIRR